MTSRQNTLPDIFFGAQQQERLAFLMAEWRIARDRGTCLAPEDEAELERLVEEEVVATARRARALGAELDQ